MEQNIETTNTQAPMPLTVENVSEIVAGVLAYCRSTASRCFDDDDDFRQICDEFSGSLAAFAGFDATAFDTACGWEDEDDEEDTDEQKAI